MKNLSPVYYTHYIEILPTYFGGQSISSIEYEFSEMFGGQLVFLKQFRDNFIFLTAFNNEEELSIFSLKYSDKMLIYSK